MTKVRVLQANRRVAQPFSNSAQILRLMGCVFVLPSDLLIATTLFASIIGYKTDVIFRQGENRTLNQVCRLYCVAGRVRRVLSIVHFGEGRKVLKERLEPPPLPS